MVATRALNQHIHGPYLVHTFNLCNLQKIAVTALNIINLHSGTHAAEAGGWQSRRSVTRVEAFISAQFSNQHQLELHHRQTIRFSITSLYGAAAMGSGRMTCTLRSALSTQLIPEAGEFQDSKLFTVY